MLSNKRFRILALLALVITTSAATYGFAAANTFTGNNIAGEGQDTISGYEVSGVSYTLDPSDPAEFFSVEFDLNGTANDVYAGVGDGTNPVYWASCTEAPADHWTCILSGSTVNVNSAIELHVSAAQ